MQNIEKLFEYNDDGGVVVKLKNNALCISINSEDGMFSGVQIKRLIRYVNSAHKKYSYVYSRCNCARQFLARRL